jgi:hypothetical protein
MVIEFASTAASPFHGFTPLTTVFAREHKADLDLGACVRESFHVFDPRIAMAVSLRCLPPEV